MVLCSGDIESRMTMILNSAAKSDYTRRWGWTECNPPVKPNRTQGSGDISSNARVREQNKFQAESCGYCAALKHTCS